MNEQPPSKKLTTSHVHYESLERQPDDEGRSVRVYDADEVDAEIARLQSIIRGKTFVTESAPEPPVDHVLELLSSVDDHLANARWEAGGTARKRLRKACELLRAAQPPEAQQAVPTPINHDLWRHLHDEHGLTLVQSELDEIVRLAQPSVPEPVVGGLRHFVEWAAGAKCDDQYAPRMVRHIAAVAKDVLEANAQDRRASQGERHDD